jgi:uroporphyrinogen-III synthase
MSKIKSLLVSQPAPGIVEKSPFFELIQKHGLNIDYVPFIRIEGVGIKEFRTQRVDILAHTAVIFTNRIAIDHFFRICEEGRIAVPETMKYLCYTEAIALYLQKYIIYRKRKISFADGTFTGLMELVLKHRDERLMLALTEPHKPEIPETLEKLKVKFDPAILARTVTADLSGVDVSRYDMVVLYSPAEVKALVEKFGDMTGGQGILGASSSGGVLGDGFGAPLVATFGDGTTRKAIEKGIVVSAMAPTPEAPSMVRALDIFISDLGSKRAPTPVTVPPVDKQARQAEEFVKAHLAKESKRAKAKKSTASSAASGNGKSGSGGAATSTKSAAGGSVTSTKSAAAPAKTPSSAGKSGSAVVVAAVKSSGTATSTKTATAVKTGSASKSGVAEKSPTSVGTPKTKK